jgi:hypothetical protein
MVARLLRRIHRCAHELFAALGRGGSCLQLSEYLFHARLRGDGGVVGAWKVERFISLHALETDDNVLQRGTEHMAHVEHARGVGRWHHDGERALGGIREIIRVEIAGFLPHLVDARLGFGGLVWLS